VLARSSATRRCGVSESATIVIYATKDAELVGST